MRTRVASLMLVLYVMILADLTLVRFPQPGAPANGTPLATIQSVWNEGGWAFVKNVAGNLLAFLPVGLLLPYLRHRRTTALHAALASGTLSLAIEALQYHSGDRVADVDDILLNTLGGLIGHGLHVAGLAAWQFRDRLRLAPSVRFPGD